MIPGVRMAGPAFTVVTATGTACRPGGSVAAGGTCNIAVQFKPTLAGAYAGKLTVTDGGGLTVVDALGGTGK